jgi:hypothetical protein
MKSRPDKERIPHLKREAHRIFAEYDPDPVNAIFQHCLIKELMAVDFDEEACVNQDNGASGS